MMRQRFAKLRARLPYIISTFFLLGIFLKMILLCKFASEAVDGMLKRLENIVQLDVSRSEINKIILTFAILNGMWMVLLWLIDIIARAITNGEDLSKYGCLPRIAFIGSYYSVAFLSFILRLAAIFWALFATFVGILSAFCAIFIDASSAICADYNNNTTAIGYFNGTSSYESSSSNSSCIDLTVLQPVIKLATDKPARLLFCDTDRTLFCSNSDSLTLTFVHLYMVGIIVLLKVVHFLDNMVAHRTRYQQQRSCEVHEVKKIDAFERGIVPINDSGPVAVVWRESE